VCVCVCVCMCVCACGAIHDCRAVHMMSMIDWQACHTIPIQRVPNQNAEAWRLLSGPNHQKRGSPTSKTSTPFHHRHPEGSRAPNYITRRGGAPNYTTRRGFRAKSWGPAPIILSMFPTYCAKHSYRTPPGAAQCSNARSVTALSVCT
jgi:hypothetical protein